MYFDKLLSYFWWKESRKERFFEKSFHPQCTVLKNDPASKSGRRQGSICLPSPGGKGEERVRRKRRWYLAGDVFLCRLGARRSVFRVTDTMKSGSETGDTALLERQRVDNRLHRLSPCCHLEIDLVPFCLALPIPAGSSP